MLTGLVHCASCRSPYVGGGIGGRVRVTRETPDGRSWFYKDSAGANEPPYRKHCPGAIGTVARRKLDRAVIDAIARELSRRAAVSGSAPKFDRVLGAQHRGSAAQLEEVRSAIATLERKRERLVALVTDGTFMQEEAATQLTSIRTELATLKSREEALRFEETRQPIDLALRDAVTRLALDFPRVARESSGPVIRELIRPWLARAIFDKNTRQLTLDIRRVPAVGPFLVTNPPEPVERQERWIERVIDLSRPAVRGKQRRQAAR